MPEEKVIHSRRVYAPANWWTKFGVKSNSKPRPRNIEGPVRPIQFNNGVEAAVRFYLDRKTGIPGIEGHFLEAKNQRHHFRLKLPTGERRAVYVFKGVSYELGLALPDFEDLHFKSDRDYVVVGRKPGDDEDSALLVRARGRLEARQHFEAWLWSSGDTREGSLWCAYEAYGEWAYINHVITGVRLQIL